MSRAVETTQDLIPEDLLVDYFEKRPRRLRTLTSLNDIKENLSQILLIQLGPFIVELLEVGDLEHHESSGVVKAEAIYYATISYKTETGLNVTSYYDNTSVRDHLTDYEIRDEQLVRGAVLEYTP
ncbi:MAG: hypothetical protein KKG75_02010 [Nanoarchaeota archaeon]|nr:hypothetical protein [Nanoarchaeota archaeon]